MAWGPNVIQVLTQMRPWVVMQLGPEPKHDSGQGANAISLWSYTPPLPHTPTPTHTNTHTHTHSHTHTHAYKQTNRQAHFDTFSFR